MKQIFTIKPYNGKVRTSLCVEDIVLNHKTALIEFGILELHHVNKLQEGVAYLVFKYGYRVPYLNVFYARRITSHTDKYLTQAIIRLLYLNPKNGTSDGNIKGITQFILSSFSATKKKESGIKDGKFIDVPVLDYDKVYTIASSIEYLQEHSKYEPDTEKMVMYSRDTKIPKNKKISINAQFRARAALSYYESAIHNAAEFLHETQEMIKITDSRIKDTDLVKVKDMAASIRTITRYMSPRTREMIKELNLTKPFKSLKTFKKFEEFKTLEYDSADVLAEKLGVSKSTIFEFRKINNLNI